jgi:phosphoribosylformylglycinamidine (FGAM) synthase-like enzyme
MATAAIAISIRAKARSCWSPSAAAISSTVGALPVAATNNLNFGNPERPEIMAQLVEAIEGSRSLRVLRNADHRAAMSACTTKRWAKASIPTPVMGIVGLMKTAKPAPCRFKSPAAR